jgi:hypothetical protein
LTGRTGVPGKNAKSAQKPVSSRQEWIGWVSSAPLKNLDMKKTTL